MATRVGTAEPSLTGGHAPLRPELQAGRPLVRIHNIELLLGNALEGERGWGGQIAGHTGEGVPQEHARVRACCNMPLAHADTPNMRLYLHGVLRTRPLTRPVLSRPRARGSEPVLAAAAAGRQFDLVHVGAAVRQPPPELLALLRPGGRMVVAVGPPAAMQVGVAGWCLGWWGRSRASRAAWARG